MDVNAEFIRGADGAPSEMLLMIRDITEKREVRDAVMRSNELLRSIVETVPSRIFWKDKDLRYLGCNTQFARDAGEDCPSDVIGKSDFELGWRDRADLYRADDFAVMRSGGPKLDYEEPQTTPDGGTIWLSTSKVPLRDDQGKVVGILGIYHDITLRKQAEDALRESLSEKEFLLGEIHHRVKNLAQQFFRAQAGIAASVKLSLDLQAVEVRIGLGVPCGLVLSELMSSSFKHAFSEGRGGEITVILRREPNREVLLQVKDTGPGLPEDFETRRSNSLGMQLVADLARQIGGRMEVGPGPK